MSRVSGRGCRMSRFNGRGYRMNKVSGRGCRMRRVSGRGSARTGWWWTWSGSEYDLSGMSDNHEKPEVQVLIERGIVSHDPDPQVFLPLVM